MYNRLMSLTLRKALRVKRIPTIAFAGSGGKTSAMFQLARELAADSAVVVSASSHLGAWQTSMADRHIIAHTTDALQELDTIPSGITLVTGGFDNGRAAPLEPELLEWLHEFCTQHGLPLLIEADGSRQRPLKAWASHEPPIPPFVEQVIVVAGLSGLKRLLTAESVHRPEIFAALSGINLGATITSEALVTVLTHTQGAQKNIPAGARKVLLLNQADTPELQAAASRMATDLSGPFESVLVASLMNQTIHAVHEPVAGIVLAAGDSSRFGAPKQLLQWKGQPFVRAVAHTAQSAGLAPVIVVTGQQAEAVQAAVADLPIHVTFNPNWSNGQGWSIAVGVRELLQKHRASAAIFLLCDQPQVNTSVLRALVEEHARSLPAVLAPMVMDRRANPVLFDAVTFDDLADLTGDVGGRAIFHKHKVDYLPWHDDRLLLDVDTPEQYQRLLEDDTL